MVIMLMSHQNTVNLRDEHASVICSLVTMATASRESIYVNFLCFILSSLLINNYQILILPQAMATTTVSTTVMKTTGINVMTENVIQKLNSLARRTSNGEDRNAYQRSGSAMVILIVWMVLMKTRHFTAAQHHSHVRMISSRAAMDVVSTKDGFVTTIMTAVTDRTRASSAILNTRRAHHKSLHVRTLNVSGINTDAVSVQKLFLVNENLLIFNSRRRG